MSMDAGGAVTCNWPSGSNNGKWGVYELQRRALAALACLLVGRQERLLAAMCCDVPWVMGGGGLGQQQVRS